MREKLKLDSFPIPSHRKSCTITHDTLIKPNDEWRVAIVAEAKQSSSKNQATLIICRDINTATDVYELLEKAFPKERLISYWRDDTQKLPKKVMIFLYSRTGIYQKSNSNAQN